MSAGLLRRAAAKLRDAAAAALADPEERWMVDQSAEDGLVLASYMPGDVHGDGTISTSCIAYFAYPGDKDARAHHTAFGVASYAALLHPPVALALADLLDYSARWFEKAEYDGYEYDDTEALPVIAVARAILREPADGVA
jgi:hypothetical protein